MSGARQLTLCEIVERLPGPHDARREFKELVGVLSDLLEADTQQETSSYCEYCDSHADKDEEGNLIDIVRHDVGCPIARARSVLATITKPPQS